MSKLNIEVDIKKGKRLFFAANKGVCIALFSLLVAPRAIQAQKDTTRKPTIDITSSYKPVLRNAIKINFSASNLQADTNRSVQPYVVPPQNLFYTYQPVPLKPLALEHDSTLDLGLRNFLKLGFGNYTTPYANAGFSFGDGKTSLLNVYADYISSKGNLKFQDFSKMGIRASGSYFTGKNEVFGNVGLNQQDYYLYGYDHLLHNYTKDQLRQRFMDVQLTVGLKNREVNGTGINYNPTLQVNAFSNKDKVTESSVIVTLPLEKTIQDAFTVKMAAKADISSFTSKDLVTNVKFSNNVFQLSPELVYSKPLYTIHAGVSPTWNNNELSVLPNIYGEAKLQGKPFLLQAGWVGRYIKNSYRNLAAINPYLQTPSIQQNTREVEIYGGIKTSVGKHFNFSAKAGFLTYHDLPFFINDTTDGKSFFVSNESKVNDLRLHADMSFISQDKFTITAGATFNGYTAMIVHDKAWGTIPLEINASMKWWAFDKVLIKADLKSFTGGPYLLKNNARGTLSGAADLSAGVEFSISKKLSAWADINNIFNNRYERWHNYPVYGLNVLGGVLLKF